MEILIIVVLAVLNGVFAMSEAAVISSRKARLQQLIDKGDENARAALLLAENPNRFLSTVQVGITLIGQLSGAFAGATIAEALALNFVGTPIAPYAQAVSFTLVVLLTTYLSLIIGELVPKRLALQSPERIASIIAPPMQVLSRITSPIVWFLSTSTSLVLRLLGVRETGDSPVTEEEIQVMIQQGIDAGVFEESEHDMVQGVFRLDIRRVSNLMTPRTEVVWLNTRDSNEGNQKIIMDSHHSRFPLCDNDLDHVIGIVQTKDILSRLFSGQSFDLRAVMKEPVFVPESMNASKLLDVFRESGKNSALVIGEYGGLEGMITIQDILEDIVGDIEEPTTTQREDGSWLVDGMIPIDDFRQLINVDEIPGAHDTFETLAGFVMTQQGNIPKEGDTFVWNKFHFEVMDMDGNRIDKILVVPPKPVDETEKEKE